MSAGHSKRTVAAALVFEAMTEAERIEFGIRIVTEAVEPHSVQALQRLAYTARATITEIESSAALDALPEGSSVDPAFFKVFLGWHNRVDQPSVAASYRLAVMTAKRESLTCKVSSELVVRHALSKMRRAN
jgi:hypothetical protein